MKSIHLQSWLQGALRAAEDAAALLTSYSSRLETAQIESKTNAYDLVSNADKDTEDLLRDRLRNVLGSAGFIGEESDDSADGQELYWVVDPLDGTSNYLCGLPIWSVSIALCDSALQPLLGVVQAPPMGRLWHATEGGGAWAGGKQIAVRTKPPGGGLRNAMLATGFPYDVSEDPRHNNLDLFCSMQVQFHKIRRLGSAAIDLALVAEGTYDGMWELKLKPWDSAAGILLITEAGGQLSRMDGSIYSPGDLDLVAAGSTELLELMRRTLQGQQQGSDPAQ
jgi:myo-inositol-1(or 4)-monophosphatase